MEIRRIMFATSVSSATVQLSRAPGLTPQPDSDPGTALHQVTITTGNNASATANTAYWQANCAKYEVIIRRLT
jgi:hypothetical protein